MGKINWSDVVFIPAAAVVFTWVINSTGGSVLIMMLFHAMNNTISGVFFSRCSWGRRSCHAQPASPR